MNQRIEADEEARTKEQVEREPKRLRDRRTWVMPVEKDQQGGEPEDADAQLQVLRRPGQAYQAHIGLDRQAPREPTRSIARLRIPGPGNRFQTAA